MSKFEINGKKYSIPESWDEISLRKYCSIFNGIDISEGDVRKMLEQEGVIISRILGEDDDFMLNIPLSIFNELDEKLSFIMDISVFIDSSIYYMVIDGKKYWMPSPDEMSLRQYIDADIVMKGDGDDKFIELLAILLLPYGEDGKFEYDGNYKDIIPKLANMPCSDCLPFIYSFFKKKEVLRMAMDCYSQVVDQTYVPNTENS